MKECLVCKNLIEDNELFCSYCGSEQKLPVPPHHLLPGTVLNQKYVIGEALGEGGFGITYKGKDVKLDITVAIKEYYPSGYANRSNTISAEISCGVGGERSEFFHKGRERFLQEAKILAKFSGLKGIVDVRDFFEENNTAYIVMEFLDGQTLKSYLKENGTLPIHTTLNLLMPVMESLSQVHRQGLIHRDISPDNIMLVEDGVKLLDFGAARNMSSIENKSLSIMLKPGYAPEEQYRSKGVQGAWTDVYALCATIYKCITGITPDDATERVYRDEVKKPSQLGVKINPEMEVALMKGLAVFKKDRWQNVEQLLYGLRSASTKSKPMPQPKPVTPSKPAPQPRPITQPKQVNQPKPTPQPPKKKSGMNKGLLIALIVIGAIVVCSIAVVLILWFMLVMSVALSSGY